MISAQYVIFDGRQSSSKTFYGKCPKAPYWDY